MFLINTKLSTFMITGDLGEVLWTGNWITYLDSLMQMYILPSQDGCLKLPSRVTYLSIHPGNHDKGIHRTSDGCEGEIINWRYIQPPAYFISQSEGSKLKSESDFQRWPAVHRSHGTISSVSCPSQLSLARHDKSPRSLLELRAGVSYIGYSDSISPSEMVVIKDVVTI